MYKLLLNSAAAFAFALPLGLGFAGSSDASDDRTNREIQNEIDRKSLEVKGEQKMLDDIADENMLPETTDEKFNENNGNRDILRGELEERMKAVFNDRQELDDRRGKGN